MYHALEFEFYNDINYSKEIAEKAEAEKVTEI